MDQNNKKIKNKKSITKSISNDQIIFLREKLTKRVALCLTCVMLNKYGLMVL